MKVLSRLGRVGAYFLLTIGGILLFLLLNFIAALVGPWLYILFAFCVAGGISAIEQRYGKQVARRQYQARTELKGLVEGIMQREEEEIRDILEFLSKKDYYTSRILQVSDVLEWMHWQDQARRDQPPQSKAKQSNNNLQNR